MNPGEIVRRTVAGRECGEVPYHIVFLGPLADTVREHFSNPDINRAVGNYLNWGLPPAEVGVTRLESGDWIDEWGVTWRETGVNRGYVLDHPLKRPDLRLLRKPALHPHRRLEGMKEACERDADLFLVAWCGDLFERAHFLRGMADLLVDMHERPRFVHALLDVCLEFCLEQVGLLARFPVDAISLSDDYGHQSGPLFSPAHFREFIRPRLKVLFEAVHSAGKLMMLHSCGDVSPFLPDLVELGLDILHPVQPEAMDVEVVKREYGRDLCLYGGISTQRLLRFGTPDRVREAVRRTKSSLSRGGRYILAPSLDLTHDIPFQNFLAFLEAARNGD